MTFLFVEATAPGQIYRASPMSLLYAVAPLHEALKAGDVGGFGPQDLIVRQPSSLDDFMRCFDAARPLLVGFSSTTYGISFVRTAASEVKRTHPLTGIIAGGSHFDGLFAQHQGDRRQLERHVPDAVDLVISGEAEAVLAEIARLVARAPGATLTALVEADLGMLTGLAGTYALWWRSRDGLRISESASTAGAVPLAPPRSTPPRELLPRCCEHQFSIFRDAAGQPLRTAQLLTYRGCMFAVNPRNACSFCFVGNSYRKADIDATVKELRTLRQAGYQAVFFDDAVFTSPSRARKAQLRVLAAALDELGFERVGFQTRADYLDHEVMEILAPVRTGWYCSIGLESSSAEILQLVGKKQSISAVEDALLLLRDHDFDVGLYLLFGALGSAAAGCTTAETRRTAEETIDFVAAQRDRGVRICCVLPGLSMILPGTRDAERYHCSGAVRHRPLIFDICHEGYPWDRFEGGLGMHAPGVTAELLEHILQYGARRLPGAWPA